MAEPELSFGGPTSSGASTTFDAKFKFLSLITSEIVHATTDVRADGRRNILQKTMVMQLGIF